MGWSKWLLRGHSALVYAFFYAPIVVLAFYSFNESQIVGRWTGFSMRWYGDFLENDNVQQSIWVSVKVCIASTLISVVLGTRMKAAGGGSIVNVSSVAAVQPTPAEVVYAMAKAGVNNLTSSLARALGPEVRVNCLMPGPFLTDIAQAWDLESFAKAARTRIPLGRGGEPHEIVGAALYLASDASSFTTGSVLKVDGGLA